MKSKFSSSNPETLTREIAALAGASRADLTSHWRALYDTEPPRRISRELLRRAIAYRLQELALGGLKPSTRRLLGKVPPPPRRDGPSMWHPRRFFSRGPCCCATGTAPSTR